MTSRTTITMAILWGAGLGLACAASPSTDATAPAREEADADPAPAADPASAETPSDTGPTSAPASAAPGVDAPKSAPAADANGETRTTEVIAGFVKERRERVRPCYEIEAKKNPKLKGDLVITFVLDPGGKVKKAEYDRASSTIDSPTMAECAAEEISSWQFPASSRGMESTISYPFNFNPRR